MPNSIPLLNNGVISDNAGTLWLPSLDLLSYAYPNVDTVLVLPSYNVISCVAKDNYDKIWASSIDSLYYQNGSTWNKILLFPEGQLLIRNMAFDTANYPIVSFENTLRKFNEQTWDTIGGVMPSIVSSLAVDDEDLLWIGTASHGVYRFDGNIMEQFSGTNLLCDSVNDIIIDHQDALWIATDRGVAKYFNNNWTTYTTSDGLVNNKVAKIFQDNINQYWFATDDRISMYNGITWISFNNPDGFIHH